MNSDRERKRQQQGQGSSNRVCQGDDDDEEGCYDGSGDGGEDNCAKVNEVNSEVLSIKAFICVCMYTTFQAFVVLEDMSVVFTSPPSPSTTTKNWLLWEEE